MPGSWRLPRTAAGGTVAGTRRSSRAVTVRRAEGRRRGAGRRAGRKRESQLMRWVILNSGVGPRQVGDGGAAAEGRRGKFGHVIFGRDGARVNEVGGSLERIRGRRRAVTGGTGRVSLIRPGGRAGWDASRGGKGRQG